MAKYAPKMAKYVPKMAKYADHAKMPKNAVLCTKKSKYANRIKNMHSHVFCSPSTHSQFPLAKWSIILDVSVLFQHKVRVH